MKRTSLLMMVCALVGAVASSAFASGQGTRDEAIALVHKVIEKLKADGPEKTFKSITDKELNDRDLYPFVNEIDGNLLANGLSSTMIGKNLSDVKDPDGKSPGREMSAIAKSGQPGWVDYRWPNPVTKKIEEKSVYVERVGDANYFVAVGVYR